MTAPFTDGFKTTLIIVAKDNRENRLRQKLNVSICTAEHKLWSQMPPPEPGVAGARGLYRGTGQPDGRKLKPRHQPDSELSYSNLNMYDLATYFAQSLSP